jgi:UDP-N-acetylmuramoyl-L-alanyl-D-glutamate--2,6-diaminopimelate ligase
MRKIHDHGERLPFVDVLEAGRATDLRRALRRLHVASAAADTVEQVLRAVRADMTAGAQLRVVFGLGSRAGSAMREEGRLTRTLADHVILTTSGFRGCPPLPALHSSLRGARKASGATLEVVLDRRRAIERALIAAGSGDVVAIPGRGALGEMRPDPRGRPIEFDDRAVARALLRAQCVAGAARAL